MKYVAIGVAALVGVILVVIAVGYTLPERHRASRDRRYAASPAVVYRAITDVAAFPSWRSGVERVEVLPDTAGLPSFREVSGDGTITYVIERRDPDRQVVTRIADRSLPFGGSWTYDLVPDASGTILRITEDGEVYNPVFRFVSRFVIGHHHTIDGYLRDLEAHLAAGSGPTTPTDSR
jgi:uncharacterized protein YndB with AHSA1/START domain